MTSTLDGTIRTWDLAGTRRTIPTDLTWKAGAWIGALAFHPDGHSLLTGGDDGVARFWDAKTGAPRTPPLMHPSNVSSAAVSPDGKIALTACWRMERRGDDFEPKGEVFRWDASSGKALGRLVEIPEMVMSATFVRGGRAVLVASRVNSTAVLQFRLVDAITGKPIGIPLNTSGPRADHVALSPNGLRFVIGSHLGNSARLWDFGTGKPLGPPLKHPDWVLAVTFSPDGRTVATGCKDKVARLWDSATGASLGKAMVNQLPVVAVAFSPDGKTLLTGCSDDFYTTGEARLWDARSGQPIAPPRTFSRGVSAIAFRPDGQAVAAASATLSLRGSEDGEVSIWHLPAPASDDVGRLRLLFQIWTGMELRDAVVYRPLTPEAWLKRKRELDKD
jgi:WD40 repeat protein